MREGADGGAGGIALLFVQNGLSIVERSVHGYACDRLQRTLITSPYINVRPFNCSLSRGQ